MKNKKQKQQLKIINKEKLKRLAEEINKAKTGWIIVAKSIHEAKEEIGDRKEWIKWCENECNIKESMAYNYSKISNYLETYPELQSMDFLSAVDYLKEKKKVSNQELVTREIPAGSFSIIYADPPWRYDFSETENREIENQYPTMDLETIKSMSLPYTEKNAILFLWATAPKLPEALEVIKAWGFEYKTHAIWDKEIIGMGYWFRGQHELLLVGTKGEVKPPQENLRVSSIIVSKRAKHSEKPKIIYDLIEKWYPHQKYIELFARTKRENWENWGNEIKNE